MPPGRAGMKGSPRLAQAQKPATTPISASNDSAMRPRLPTSLLPHRLKLFPLSHELHQPLYDGAVLLPQLAHPDMIGANLLGLQHLRHGRLLTVQRLDVLLERLDLALPGVPAAARRALL